jgi:putative ABC transport system permease protein
VIGGSRQQLLVQFLGESLLLAWCYLVGICIDVLILPIFNQLADKSLSLTYLFDWRLILELVALFSLTVFLAGFYPALVLSGLIRFKLVQGFSMVAGPGYKNRWSFSIHTFILSHYCNACHFIPIQLSHHAETGI